MPLEQSWQDDDGVLFVPANQFRDVHTLCELNNQYQRITPTRALLDFLAYSWAAFFSYDDACEIRRLIASCESDDRVRIFRRRGPWALQN